MKKPIFFGLMFFACYYNVNARGLTVEDCQEKARANYPLVRQYALIEQAESYSLSNAGKGYLPQLTLTARATYQSEVVGLPAGLPFTLPSLSKDQYQAAVEASQVIWDGGAIKARKKAVVAGAGIEKQKLEVDLFALNQRVNQLFFGILLLREQIRQNEILQGELLVNLKRVGAYVENGIANQSDIDVMKVEQLNAMQREVELKSTLKSYAIMLSALTGMEITERTELSKPVLSLSVLGDSVNHRPELSLFEARNQWYESQKDELNAGNLPKVGLFLQGGYGKPGLNMLSNTFSPYYIGGIRLAWNFSGLYSQKNNLGKIDIGKKTVEVEKETFLFNTGLQSKQQRTEIERLQQQVQNDDEIIRLRGRIKNAATARLENGTLTVTDLIRDINLEDQARQVKNLHEIQLLIAVYQLKDNINN